MIGIGLLSGTISALFGLLLPRVAWAMILLPVTLVPAAIGYFYFDALDGVCFATARTAGIACSLTSEMVHLAESSAPDVMTAILVHIGASVGIILTVRVCQRFTRWLEACMDSANAARIKKAREDHLESLRLSHEAMLARNAAAEEARMATEVRIARAADKAKERLDEIDHHYADAGRPVSALERALNAKRTAA